MSDSRIRGGHKSRITLLITQLKEALTKEETVEAWVRDQLMEIRRQYDLVLAYDAEIIKSTDNIDKEITDSSDFTLLVTGEIRKTNEWLEKKSSAQWRTQGGGHGAMAPPLGHLIEINPRKIHIGVIFTYFLSHIEYI